MTFMTCIRPSLPPELIDAIIDAAANNEGTLRALSVVSKSCVPRCRRYLFQSIEFSTDRGEDTLAKRHERFRSIIAQDPRVRTYIQNLSIQDIEMSYPQLPWIITNTRFHETLHLLGPHLKRFTFVVDEYEWVFCPASLKLAFMSILTSPSLTYIRLQGIQCMPRACCVALGSQVVDLSIVRSTFSNAVDPDLPVVDGSFIPKNLYWLCLEDVDEESIDILLNAWIPAQIPGHDRPLFPSLTALSIGPTDEDALDPIRELIQAGRETIQYFYWDYDYGSQSVLSTSILLHSPMFIEWYLPARPLNTQPLNLSILQRLFAIKYEVTFYPDEEVETIPNPTDHFNGLISLLQTVNPGTIQQVDVKVDFKSFDDAVESLQWHDGWSSLNHTLASESLNQIYQIVFQLDLETLFSEDGLNVKLNVDTNLLVRKAEIKTLLEARLTSLAKINSYIFILTIDRQRI